MIKLDLYYVGYSNNKLIVKEKNKCFLNKKTLVFPPEAKVLNDISPPGRFTSLLVEPSEHSFMYSYSIPFHALIIKGKKKKRLNARFTYIDNSEFNGPNNKEVSYTYYSHLSMFQKLKNSLNFNKLWIQQPSNVMWIANMIILILACIATFIKLKCD